MRQTTALLFVLLFQATTAITVGAQGPVFRAGIDLLTIDVTAIDRDDRPVRDLQATDFTVMINGQPRKVVAARFYGATSAPGTEPGALASPADVQRPADAPARTVVLSSIATRSSRATSRPCCAPRRWCSTAWCRPTR